MKLIIFDVDGTLVRDNKSDELLPDVQDYLENYHDYDTPIAIATNQGGPACRTAPWCKNPDSYPSTDDVLLRIEKIVSQVSEWVDAPVFVMVAWGYFDRAGKYLLPQGFNEDMRGCDPNWRKPNPGMIVEAAKHFGISLNDNVLFVGDSEDDSETAANADVFYIDRDSFFPSEETVGREMQW